MNQTMNEVKTDDTAQATQTKKTLWQRFVAYLKELTRPTDMPPGLDGYDRYVHRDYLACDLRYYNELFSGHRMY